MNLEASFHPFAVAFGIISILLLIGFVLRVNVKLFQRFLIPASLIGGILGFIVMSTGIVPVSHETFSLITYHLFNVAAISITLTGNSERKSFGKKMWKGATWLTLGWTVVLCIQSLTGFGVFTLWNEISGTDHYSGLGLLTGHGFAQGPGQALGIGSIWESFDIQNAVSIGLTFAAVGYFVAFFIGVPLVNYGVRKGLTAFMPKDLPTNFRKGVYTPEENESIGRQTTLSSNIDTLAFHIALIAAIYGVSYYIGLALKPVLGEDLIKVLFGFIYVIGLILAFLTRFILQKLNCIYLLDNDIFRHITSSAVDLLLIPTMMAIQFGVFINYFVPITITCLLTVLFTGLVVYFYSKKSKMDFRFERGITLYTGSMGTLANSLVLLKIIDPDFRSPIAMEVILFNIVGIFLMFHIILLAGMMPQIGLYNMLGIYAGTATLYAVVWRILGAWKGKPK